jgi:hypothetical protein
MLRSASRDCLVVGAFSFTACAMYAIPIDWGASDRYTPSRVTQQSARSVRLVPIRRAGR